MMKMLPVTYTKLVEDKIVRLDSLDVNGISDDDVRSNRSWNNLNKDKFYMDYLPRCAMMAIYCLALNKINCNVITSPKIDNLISLWKKYDLKSNMESTVFKRKMIGDVLSSYDIKIGNVKSSYFDELNIALYPDLINMIMQVILNHDESESFVDMDGIEIRNKESICVIRTPYYDFKQSISDSVINFARLVKTYPTLKYLYMIDIKCGKIHKYYASDFIGENMDEHINSLQKYSEHLIDDINEIKDVTLQTVGSHMGGGLNNLMKFLSRLDDKSKFTPKQIFLGNSRSGKVSSSLTAVRENTMSRLSNFNENVKDNIRNNIYVHSCYTINICDRKQSIKRHIEDLVSCSMYGFGGLVIHVGKNVKRIDNVAALNEMMISLKRIINTATEIIRSRNLDNLDPYIAPLLLETSAGEGTETLTTITEMIEFCGNMLDMYPKRFGICIDTCHVFSLGYSPLYYTTKMYEIFGDAIKLVHLNDSMREQGAYVDRHRAIGEGKIKLEELVSIANFCHNHNIAALSEPPS